MIITLFRVEELGVQFGMLVVSYKASGSHATVTLPVLSKLPALVPPGHGMPIPSPQSLIMLCEGGCAGEAQLPVRETVPISLYFSGPCCYR